MSSEWRRQRSKGNSGSAKANRILLFSLLSLFHFTRMNTSHQAVLSESIPKVSDEALEYESESVDVNPALLCRRQPTFGSRDMPSAICPV